MSSRGRWALALAPVAITVLIAAVVGGFIVVQNQRQADQIEQADGVAADYLSEVATFRTSVQTAISKAGQNDPATLRAALEKAVADPPQLADADTFGMQSSTTYTRAEQVEADLLEPYESLDAELGKAVVSVRYVKAARKALGLRVTDFVDSTTLSSSSQLRSSLIPAVVEARDTLEDVPVPKGQDELDETVEEAVQYLIDQATILADRIDRNQSYSFTYDEQFQTAITAVEDYATEVRGDVTEELNAVAELAK